MSPARFSIRRPVTIAMCVLAVLVLGVIAFIQLPVDLLPDISFPVVAVLTTYPGASPAEVEEFVTKPIEQAAAVVEDLESIRSISQQDISVVIIEFDWGKDMDWAAFDTREKVDPVIERLPEDVGRPIIMKIDPQTMLPVMTLDVTGLADLLKLRELADDVIKPELEKLPGVAAANIYGGLQREILVEVDWERLKAHNLPISQVEGALRRENLNMPAGFTIEGQREFTLRTIGEFDVVEDIDDVVVAVRQGLPVHLRDIANVYDTHKEVRSYARLNGEPSVSISIQKETEANTVTVAEVVGEALEELPKKLPEGVEITITSREADFIEDSLHNLYATALEGAILAMVIIFLFLGTFRGTLISAISIPLSLLVTFMLMFFNNMTLNIITMGGLVLAIGRIVDDSVVVLENIYRHIEEGEPVLEAAVTGTEELWGAIAAVTFTTMSVFFPLIFVGGMVSTIFTPMSLVVMLGLFASLVVAVTVVPLLSQRMLRPVSEAGEEQAGGLFGPVNRMLAGWSRGFDALAGQYRRAIAWCLDHRAVVVVIAVVVFAVSLAMVPLVGMEFFPHVQQDELRISMETPIGSSVHYTNERAGEVEQILAETEGIEHYEVYMGTAGGISGAARGGGTRTASFTVKLLDRTERERTANEIEQDLRERFAALPGVTTRFEQRMGGMGADLEVSIIGDQLEVLQQLGNQTLAAMREVRGVTDLDLGWEPASPEYHVLVDREKAGRLGLTVSDIAHTVQTKVRGTQELTKFRQGGEEYDITVRAAESDRDWVEDVRDTDVVTPRGKVVPLRAIATIVPALGPTQITRDERERSLTVSASTQGRALSEIVDEIDSILSEQDWPEGYRYEFGGSEEDRREAFGGMATALVLGVLLIYMILAAQFESLVHPLVIMLAIPLEVIGVFGALILTGTTLSIMVFLGILMLTGIVVSNSILLVQMVNVLRERGNSIRDALIEGGAIRLRPILMTALATLFAMLPLALAMRTGSELWQPLGIAVIGGLTASTFLTLFVVPVAYSIAESAVRRLYTWLGYEETAG
ncbi:MAG: efflux RND transporter permease subunit [Armatimonadota bacterium]|nr:efflux RND transporter permease subunit [Armatimonadota bacterium]